MRADGDKEESGLEIMLPRSSPQIFFPYGSRKMFFLSLKQWPRQQAERLAFAKKTSKSCVCECRCHATQCGLIQIL